MSKRLTHCELILYTEPYETIFPEKFEHEQQGYHKEKIIQRHKSGREQDTYRVVSKISKTWMVAGCE